MSASPSRLNTLNANRTVQLLPEISGHENWAIRVISMDLCNTSSEPNSRNFEGRIRLRASIQRKPGPDKIKSSAAQGIGFSEKNYGSTG
jgi:hypothetical protein